MCNFVCGTIRVRTGLKVLEFRGLLEKSLKIKSALKYHSKALKSP